MPQSWGETASAWLFTGVHTDSLWQIINIKTGKKIVCGSILDRFMWHCYAASIWQDLWVGVGKLSFCLGQKTTALCRPTEFQARSGRHNNLQSRLDSKMTIIKSTVLCCCSFREGLQLSIDSAYCLWVMGIVKLTWQHKYIYSLLRRLEIKA